MTKTVKNKKRRTFNLFGFTKILLVASVMLAIFSSVFVQTYNNSITVSIENINREADILQSQNNALNLEIQNLISKDRIYDIATEAGLSQNQNNVISIVEGE